MRSQSRNAQVYGIMVPAAWTVPVSDHARQRHGREHVTPDMIRQAMRERAYEEYRSRNRGQVLFLVWLDGDTWGGRIMGWVSRMEITAFARPRKDWDRVIRRDKYRRVY